MWGRDSTGWDVFGVWSQTHLGLIFTLLNQPPDLDQVTEPLRSCHSVVRRPAASVHLEFVRDAEPQVPLRPSKSEAAFYPDPSETSTTTIVIKLWEALFLEAFHFLTYTIQITGAKSQGGWENHAYICKMLSTVPNTQRGTDERMGMF